MSDIAPSTGPGQAASPPVQAAVEEWVEPGPAAGFWVRAGAAFIDGLVLLAALMAAAILVVLAVKEETMRRRLIQLASILIGGGYYTALTAFTGQTLGKMAAGIRVVTKDGGNVGVGRSLGRWAAYSLSSLPIGLGFVAAAFNPQRKGLHDFVAGTRVVYLPNVSPTRKTVLAGMGALFVAASVAYAGLAALGERGGAADPERMVKEGAAIGTLKSLRTVSAMYKADKGKAPASLDELKQLKDFTAMPKLELPDHRSSDAVETYSGAVVGGNVDAAKLKDTGHWAYDPASGQIFIDCTHVDSDGNSWFKY